MIRHYSLDENGEPIPATELKMWCDWFENAKRVVNKTKIGDSEVSTVFLGLDHNYRGIGGPILWETMVFGGAMDQEMERCSGSREQAQAMHDRMVERVRQASGESEPEISGGFSD